MKDMNERFAKDQFARTALRWCFNICEMQNVIKLMMFLLPERGKGFLKSWRILGSLGDGPQLTFPRHKKSGSLPSLHPHYQFQSFFSFVSFPFLHLLTPFSFPEIGRSKVMFELHLEVNLFYWKHENETEERELFSNSLLLRLQNKEFTWDCGKLEAEFELYTENQSRSFHDNSSYSSSNWKYKWSLIWK